jgi:hypothetical protein
LEQAPADWTADFFNVQKCVLFDIMFVANRLGISELQVATDQQISRVFNKPKKVGFSWNGEYHHISGISFEVLHRRRLFMCIAYLCT